MRKEFRNLDREEKIIVLNKVLVSLRERWDSKYCSDIFICPQIEQLEVDVTAEDLYNLARYYGLTHLIDEYWLQQRKYYKDQLQTHKYTGPLWTGTAKKERETFLVELIKAMRAKRKK